MEESRKDLAQQMESVIGAQAQENHRKSKQWFPFPIYVPSDSEKGGKLSTSDTGGEMDGSFCGTKLEE